MWADTTNSDEELAYYTNNGRPVFGGGGIIPDIVVEPEQVNDLVWDLQRKAHYFSWMMTNGGTSNYPDAYHVKWEQPLYMAYPYLCYIGSGGAVGSPDVTYYDWGFRHNHRNPSRALVTYCPIAYSQHSSFGYGFFTGSHYMHNANLGPTSSVNHSMLSRVWKGANLLCGDGHVEWLASERARAVHRSATTSYPGEWKVAMANADLTWGWTAWANGVYKIDIRSGEY